MNNNPFSNQDQTVGILLAGGMSRRFGKPKAFQIWQDKAFYQHAYEALASVCNAIVIVTRPALIRCFPENYQTVTDVANYDGCGPLAGIYTGMKENPAAYYVVLPCDMPLVNKPIIQRLFQNHRLSVTVVDTENVLQPLVSIWDSTTLPVIRNALEQGEHTMKQVLQKLDIHKVFDHDLTSEPERFMNINTTEDLEEMTEWFKS